MRLSSSFVGLLKGVFGLIALGAISFLIWFVLPAITMGGSDPFGSAFTRGAMILSMFAMVFVYKLQSYLSQRRRNEAMSKAIATPEQKEQKDEVGKTEVAELKGKFDEAITLLKKVKTKEGAKGSYLYVLPWYLIIGPSGSGKTTALLNSDLHFPLLDSVGASVKGVGGTRNCDWWFTDQAVLLDTAGRYTMQQEQNEVDEVEWKGFLGLLKKFRTRKPLNGLIISFPVDSLLKLPESELITHAKVIKQRVQELQETFNVRFPVYVTFTKTDLLPGFTEYFDDMDREDRAQVWGITFPYNDEATADYIPELLTEYRGLQERLQARASKRLYAESDATRRSQIYLFPRTLDLLQGPISTFINEIFKPTRYETQPLLRGIYLTSGTQDGNTLDRIINSLGSRFGLTAEQGGAVAGKGKGYFLHNLFTQIIFKESGLAGTSLRYEKRLFRLNVAAYSLAVLFAIGLSTHWLFSYFENKSLIAQVNAETLDANEVIAEVSRYDKSPLAPLIALNQLRALTTGYEDQKNTTYKGVYQMGLYQGDKLGQEAVSAYKRLLEKGLLPRLLVNLETAMHDSRNDAEHLYETLRVYLMFGDAKYLDKSAVMSWFRNNWRQTLPNNLRKDEYQNLEAHLSTLVDLLPEMTPFQPDVELVASARGILSKQPPARRFYFKLRQDGLTDPDLEPYRLVDALGTDAAFLFRFTDGRPLTSEINAFFTRSGYQAYFLKNRDELIEKYLTDEWVMGPEYGLVSVGMDTQMLQGQVEKLYLDEYLYRWKEYLSAIGFKNANTPRETLLLIKELSRKNSPLIKLFESIQFHTSAEAFSVFANVEASKEGAVQTFINDLAKDGEEAAAAAQVPLGSTDNPVVMHFRDLNKLVEGDENTEAPIKETLKLLDELYVYMSAMEGAINKDKQAFKSTTDPLGTAAVLGNIEIEASRQPQPLSGMLNKVSMNARALTVADAKSFMQRQWVNEVSRHCKNMVSGRYPFNKRSHREATFDDLAAYFGPGGILESYYNDFAMDYVDSSRRPWRWNIQNGVNMGFSSEVLNQLENGRVIRDTFFRTGSTDPAISFELKPLSMDKSILRMSLSVNGQQMSYAHGPQRGKRFRWPAYDHNQDRGLARLVIVTSAGQESITEQGDWALFRLFDKAKIKKLDRERYRLTFNFKNTYRVSLELRAGSVYNPFQMSELRQVRCQ